MRLRGLGGLGGLSVIAQKQGRPWTLLSHNDLAHLPVELRTGLPEVYPV